MKTKPTYRPAERKQVLSIVDALHAGLSPALAQESLDDLEQVAQQRLAAQQAQRQALAERTQAASGQLGQLAIQMAQTNPEMPADQLSSVLGAQQQALGLGPKVSANVAPKLPGLVASLYSGDTSVFAQPDISPELSPERKASIGDSVMQAAQQGVPLATLIDQNERLMGATGEDPENIRLVADQIRSAYNAFTETTPLSRSLIGALPSVGKSLFGPSPEEVYLDLGGSPTELEQIRRKITAARIAASLETQGLGPQQPPAG